jgi:hypothetical protein
MQAPMWLPTRCLVRLHVTSLKMAADRDALPAERLPANAQGIDLAARLRSNG